MSDPRASPNGPPSASANLTSEGPGGRSIRNEVSRLVNQTANLARNVGDRAAAKELAADIATTSPNATIVIVGEAKQGKSSLVNALVGVDGLSPVNADIATSAPLLFSYGPERTATLALDDGDRLKIDADELPNWVSMASAPLAQIRQVTSVDVTVPSKLLEPGVTLIDTPGVGGLVAGHAKMTLRALESARAMLFVTDADTKLTDPELRFLQQATARIAAVVFVITKIDATPQWADVVAENREVLREWAPQYAEAPMIPVSARLASRARALRARDEDKITATNLMNESGLNLVQAHITRKIVPAAGALALGNAAALARSTASQIRTKAALHLESYSDDPEISAALEAEKQRLERVREDQMMWSSSLERALLDARYSLKEKVRASGESIQQAVTELIETSGRGDDDMIVARLDADLDARTTEVAEEAVTAVASIFSRVLEEVDLDPDQPADLVRANSGTWHLKPYKRAGTSANDNLAIVMASSSGFSLVRTVLSVFSLTPMGWAAGAAMLPVGLGLGLVMNRVRGQVQHRQEMGAWARNEIARANNELSSEVERALTVAKLDIQDAVRAGLNTRSKEVNAALEAAKAARAKSQSERQRSRNNDQEIIKAAAGLVLAADELVLATLRAAKLTAEVQHS